MKCGYQHVICNEYEAWPFLGYVKSNMYGTLFYKPNENYTVV
jgi:hypothetical protein